MRRLLTGWQTRGYGRAFLEVLQSAKHRDDQETPVPQRISRALLAKPYGLSWPQDFEVAEALETRTFYGQVSQERIRIVLGPIDRRIQQSRHFGEQPEFNYDALTIEHVMPREWKANWPVTAPDGPQRELAERDRARHIHRLGNLTLVTGSLNPSMSNAGWDTKRAELRKHSQLAINADIVQHETWDENTITDRARRLAAVACSVWARPQPRPDSGA